MKATTETKPTHPSEVLAPETSPGNAGGKHAPRRLTLAENAILTCKVLAMAGALVAVLWALSNWSAAR
jgi:hypothetical protein